jgi:hypothetical protein
MNILFFMEMKKKDLIKVNITINIESLKKRKKGMK